MGIDPTPNNVTDHKASSESASKPYCLDGELRDFHLRLVSALPAVYDESRESQVWTNLLEKWSAKKRHSVVVFSNERLSSVYYAFDDLQEKSFRVAKVFGNPHILIVIRRQEDIIQSQYRDQPFDPRNLEEGGPVPFDEWLCLLREDKRFIDSLKYNRVVRMYEERFGEPNVHVLPFERLVDDVERAANSMYEWMGIKSDVDVTYDEKYNNSSPSAGYFAYKQVVRSSVGQALSQLLPEGVKQKINDASKLVLGGTEKKKIEMESGIVDEIKDFYRSGNEKLSARYNLNLGSYGYY